MKQIKAIFTMICLFIFLSMPVTAFAAPEPEPATWTERMEGKPADAGEDVESAGYEKAAETGKKTGTSPEAGERRKQDRKQSRSPP